MSPDELVYLGILAASIPIGFLFRYLIRNFSLSPTPLFTFLRSAPALSLAWTFLYLLFFRLVTWFGLPPPTPFANAIQLLLTLKMVSLANEVQSFHIEKKQEVSSFSKSPVVGGLSQEPSLYDMIAYSYCYVGIMTGPFFRFQTYVDWLRQPSSLDLPGRVPCMLRLRLVPVYGALFLTANAYFPLAYVLTEEFLEHHFFFRLFYMTVVFFVFRMRFYAAWCGAEAGCISAGLGCYPEGALSKPGGGPTVNYRQVSHMIFSPVGENSKVH
ncbi:unnamed protein product [Coregonus sp. 'balchen']|nr:unnamed protein product [Coregonus sp. 'balchen']